MTDANPSTLDLPDLVTIAETEGQEISHTVCGNHPGVHIALCGADTSGTHWCDHSLPCGCIDCWRCDAIEAGTSLCPITLTECTCVEDSAP